MLIDRWKRHRLRVFAVVGTALMLVGGLVKWVGFEEAGRALLLVLWGLGTVLIVLIVADVTVHALLGRGQACMTCGHVRPLRSFRPAGPCPRCGDF
ncbi:hypothetical protein [Tautonia marina]|uniref:hypothetical protein n=1 Tax=Tautonia marina TaxID=2653855 RepID=UPI001260B750|nr:hypothetical protein [Tautonia marina]